MAEANTRNALSIIFFKTCLTSCSLPPRLPPPHSDALFLMQASTENVHVARFLRTSKILSWSPLLCQPAIYGAFPISGAASGHQTCEYIFGKSVWVNKKGPTTWFEIIACRAPTRIILFVCYLQPLNQQNTMSYISLFLCLTFHNRTCNHSKESECCAALSNSTCFSMRKVHR